MFDWIVITLLAPVDALVNVIVPATAGTPRLSNVQTFDAHVVVIVISAGSLPTLKVLHAEGQAARV